MLGGHVITGLSLSTTLTEKLQLAVLPSVSRAVHMTLVVPLGNLEPEGGEQVRLATPEHSSVAVTLKVTTAEH